MRKENIMGERNDIFFLIFTMKLFSTALSCVNARLTFNFYRIFLFLNMKTLNIKGAKFEFYMKKPIIVGAGMERSATLRWLHFSNLLPLFRK